MHFVIDMPTRKQALSFSKIFIMLGVNCIGNEVRGSASEAPR